MRPVRSAAELDDWLAVVRDCGWFEGVEPARRLYESLGYDGLYLAQDAAASAFFAPPTVLLNALAVRPRRRRRGIGRSVALARLRDARARGCTTAILAPIARGEEAVRVARLPIGAAAAGLLVLPPDPGQLIA